MIMDQFNNMGFLITTLILTATCSLIFEFKVGIGDTPCLLSIVMNLDQFVK